MPGSAWSEVGGAGVESETGLGRRREAGVLVLLLARMLSCGGISRPSHPSASPNEPPPPAASRVLSGVVVEIALSMTGSAWSEVGVAGLETGLGRRREAGVLLLARIVSWCSGGISRPSHPSTGPNCTPPPAASGSGALDLAFTLSRSNGGISMSSQVKVPKITPGWLVGRVMG
ncbi:hypothetical protein DFP72DRAFT_922560 [Ephemerocybe angulata]|uniref:Uncharacterized protein n=1 Tax=Ephemerocybe angulata TaxID=980116 RepID=A0A8H6HGN3_9AGAR|nr:hypothetical protein DFP72DRAFT_922560 [Tulosesus angulatus]